MTECQARPWDTPPSLRASFQGAAFLTWGNLWGLASPSLGPEGLEEAWRGRGAVLSLDLWLLPEHSFQPWSEKRASVPRFCNPRSHSPGGSPTSPRSARPALGSSSVSSLWIAGSNRPRTKDKLVPSAPPPPPPPPHPEPFTELPRHRRPARTSLPLRKARRSEASSKL